MIKPDNISIDKKSKTLDFNEDDDDEDKSLHQPLKQQRANINEISTPTTMNKSDTLPSPSNTSIQPGYGNNSGPRFIYFPQTSQNQIIKQNNPTIEDPNKLSPSWKNAFQMTNINMPSMSDYLSNVSMPSMPNISMPNLPSMPTITMPSIPNLTMPNISMPSMPNINFPSINISDIMPNALISKNFKTWGQIFQSVKESRKNFSSICPTLPFDFRFCYDQKKEKLRIYFLSNNQQSETTLYFCDVDLLNDYKEKYLIESVSMINDYSDKIVQQNHYHSPSHQHNHHQQQRITDNYNYYVNDGNDDGDGGIEIDSDKFNDYNNLSQRHNFHDNDDLDIADCDYDIENNNSSCSPTSMTLSSSTASNDSYTQTSLDVASAMKLRKSITSATNSISNLDTIEWKQLLRQQHPDPTVIFNTNIDNNSPSKNCSSNCCDNKRKTLNDSNVSPSSSSSSSKIDSQEEDLILQRKRIMINGILAYDFHPQMARFVFAMKNAIYWFDDVEMTNSTSNTVETHPNTEIDSIGMILEQQASPNNNHHCNNPPYVPKKLHTNDYFKSNATICPNKPDLVAYTADHDLWVCELITGYDLRLTNCDYSRTSIMAGIPSFVMQEEFSRYTGFWWRPAGRNFRYVETILCEFVDEFDVDCISVSNCDGINEIHRFPKAGSINAKSTLKLVHIHYSEYAIENKIVLTKIDDLDVKFDSLLDEYEYLLRCNWMTDDVIWVQLLNRHQNRLVIVLTSISKKFPTQIIYEESQKDHWYNCHEILYFFNKNKNKNTKNDNNDYTETELNCDITVGSKVEFLWSSELSGFRHLYKIAIEIVDNDEAKKNDNNSVILQTCHTMDDSNPIKSESPSEKPLYAKTIYNRQLTSGNWEVSSSEFWVNEERDLIFFMANKDSALENHLYVISLSSQSSSRISPPRRLSREDFTHTDILFDPDLNFCIDFLSNLTIPPCAYLNRVIYPESDDSLNIELKAFQMFFNLPDDVKLEDSSEYFDKVQNLGPTPQLFEYKLQSGELIHGFLFKPENMEPGLKYPVLLEIYGGPEVQLVTKSFRELRMHRRHLVASEGYIVVGFDSRGSKHRGVDFEKHIYKRLGQVEIDDQVEALQWLAKNTDFMNMDRVAIHGWSYGGYLSLMALVKRPDIFKCAIAGAPVTNWFLYDTGYTERYMGLPKENEDNYKRSNILTYVKNFPNEYNRLLIVHGLMDDNVHFRHTTQLIKALVQAGKPYSLNIFPNERHSLKKTQSSEHFEATLIYYLQQNL